MKITRIVTRDDMVTRWRNVSGALTYEILTDIGIWDSPEDRFKITIDIHSGGEYLLKKRGSKTLYSIYKNGSFLSGVCIDKMKAVFGQCKLNRRFDIEVVQV